MSKRVSPESQAKPEVQPSNKPRTPDPQEMLDFKGVMRSPQTPGSVFVVGCVSSRPALTSLALTWAQQTPAPG